MPQLTQVVHLDAADRPRKIVGVASLDSCRLFVLRSPSKQQIEVYDKTTFDLRQTLEVAGLSDNLWNGLTACANGNCLYVIDCVYSCAYRIELSDNYKALKWQVGDGPTGLSLNYAHNLLVTCYRANKLAEYTPNGSLVREVNLQLHDVQLRPLHATQLTDGQFVVSLHGIGSLPSDVVEVNSQGQVTNSYEDQLQSTAHRQFKLPRHVTINTINGCIFVADHWDNRMVMLSRSLKYTRELNASDNCTKLRQARCLFLDDFLYAGDYDGRIFVYDIRRQWRRCFLKRFYRNLFASWILWY